jgi:hypothetical protein
VGERDAAAEALLLSLEDVLLGVAAYLRVRGRHELLVGVPPLPWPRDRVRLPTLLLPPR